MVYVASDAAELAESVKSSTSEYEGGGANGYMVRPTMSYGASRSNHPIPS